MSIATFEEGPPEDFNPEYQRRQLLKDAADRFFEAGERCRTFVVDNEVMTLALLGGLLPVPAFGCRRVEESHQHGVMLMNMTNKLGSGKPAWTVRERCENESLFSHGVAIPDGEPPIPDDPDVTLRDVHARHLIEATEFTAEDTLIAGNIAMKPNN